MLSRVAPRGAATEPGRALSIRVIERDMKRASDADITGAMMPIRLRAGIRDSVVRATPAVLRLFVVLLRMAPRFNGDVVPRPLASALRDSAGVRDRALALAAALEPLGL